MATKKSNTTSSSQSVTTENQEGAVTKDEFPMPKKRRTPDIEKAEQYRADNPPRPGRKTLLTPEIMETIVDLLKRGNYLATAAKYVGVDPATLGQWRAKGERLMAEGRPEDEYDETELLYQNFAIEVGKARSLAEIKAVEVIRNAMPNQWQAAAWYLERTNNADWGRTVRTELTGEGGGPVSVDVDSVYRKLEAVTQRVIDVEAVEDAELEAGE